MNSNLHPAMPPLPERMKRLHVDPRGFPAPWFVTWFHANGKPFEKIDLPIRPGDYPDFRVIDPRKMGIAYRQRLCWVCGGQLGKFVAFVIGPMCAINRTSGEPPSHKECALFSARACPFLTKPQVERRASDLPEEVHVHPMMLMRNPGVTMVWTTLSYKYVRSGDEVVFRIGDPVDVQFFAFGREATREEIMHSIDTGLPALRDLAENQGEDAQKELDELYTEAVKLVPAA